MAERQRTWKGGSGSHLDDVAQYPWRDRDRKPRHCGCLLRCARGAWNVERAAVAEHVDELEVQIEGLNDLAVDLEADTEKHSELRVKQFEAQLVVHVEVGVEARAEREWLGRGQCKIGSTSCDCHEGWAV